MRNPWDVLHYDDVIMGAMTSQITSLTIVYSTLYSGADQRKHQSSASIAFVQGIHRGSMNSPHKRPVTRKRSPFDDVIMVRIVLPLEVSTLTARFMWPTWGQHGADGTHVGPMLNPLTLLFEHLFSLSTKIKIPTPVRQGEPRNSKWILLTNN